MTKSDFCKNVQEELEITDFELDLETSLKDLDEFDSLAIMTLIAFIDDNFEITISSEKIQNIDRLGDLVKLIGDEKFTG